MSYLNEYHIDRVGKAQGDAAATNIFAVPFSSDLGKPFRSHQISIGKSTSTVGTVAIFVRAQGMTLFEPLLDGYGTAIVWNAATVSGGVKTYSFDKVGVAEIKVVPTGVDALYDVSVSGV